MVYDPVNVHEAGCHDRFYLQVHESSHDYCHEGDVWTGMALPMSLPSSEVPGMECHGMPRSDMRFQDIP